MNIGLLYTGGTIGCVETKEGLTPLCADEFNKAFEKIVIPIIQKKYDKTNIFNIQFNEDGSTLDSTNIQPKDWCTMATKILDAYEKCDAFIVLHGTDTMSWSASALSFLMLGLDKKGAPNAVLDKPIIITGSQLPLFVEGEKKGIYDIVFNTDALQNICGAVFSCYSSVVEVCLYFNSTLMRGNRTIKTNANSFNAFSSPNYPHLGECKIEFVLNSKVSKTLPHLDKKIRLNNKKAYDSLAKQLEYITKNIDTTIVLCFASFPAFYDKKGSVLGDMLSSCVNKNVDGLILESYGAGNFPCGNPENPSCGSIYKLLQKAVKEGIIVIDCTQVVAGMVNLKTYASGSWMDEIGVIAAYDMIGITAFSKLMYLNTLAGFNNWSKEDIKNLMVTNLSGEMIPINS